MYQALYRKYRPTNFDEVVGQDYIVQTLKNSILNNKTSHAYMFFGPRGIGKTTIAKILARAINCENSKDGNPCEKCDNCKKSINSIDIIEIDAASNNGVDEIREIRNKVNIVPSELKYKVYIIDEVHMLTTGAFNALLKTLEEPPKHVVFILATTDPEKVSDTIISRCQCFSFKRITVDNIENKLKEVCKKEKITTDDKILKLIAEYSDGGLRDSLSTLDKIASYKTDKLTENDFYEINDMVLLEEVENFKNVILNSDYEEIVNKINTYNQNGKNLIEILSQLMNLLCNEIIDNYNNNKRINEKEVELLNLLNEKMFDIKKSSNPKIYIEVLLLTFINNNNNETKIETKKEKVVKKEDIIEKQEEPEEIKEEVEEKVEEEPKKEEKKDSNIINIDEIIKVRINNIFATASKEEKKKDLELFEKFNEYVFDPKYGHVASELLNAKLQVSGEIGILLSYEYPSVVEQNLKNIDEITKVYNELTNSNKKIAIITDEEWNKLKEEYIESIKNNKKYDIIEEPSINSSTDEENLIGDSLESFKDIIEIS